MKSRNLSVLAGLISLGLLITLIIKLTGIPGGVILPGWFLGGMIIILILVCGLLVSWLVKLLLKKLPFFTIYFSLTAIVFIIYHYQLYSPTLRIIVPENYVGEVNLIESNLSDNILTLDSNGIGYLNEWTFQHTYSKPIVVDVKGNDLTEQCAGFNPSTFWKLGITKLSNSTTVIKALSFDIVPQGKTGEKQYYNTNLSELVDKKKIK